jgi:aspartate carbamoyltransferase regulatory subunit
MAKLAATPNSKSTVKSFVAEIPGGGTSLLLRILKNETESVIASVNWKEKDSVEFRTSTDASSVENLILRIKLLFPTSAITDRETGIRTEERHSEKWFENLITCPNKNCISVQSKEPTTPKFRIVSWDHFYVQCYYCGRYADRASIESQLLND